MDTRKRLGIAAAFVLLSGAGLAVVMWLQSAAALNQARSGYDESTSLEVTVRPLSPTATPFQPIPAVPDFTSAAVFNGGLWLAGHGGLVRRDLGSGEFRDHWVPGVDLPAAPITALAVGRIGGSNEPQLLAATAGAGLLSVSTSGDMIQMLPADRRLADLTTLLPLATGGVLLGTQRTGILIWDGQRLERYHDRLSDQAVTALAGDEGDLWIGTLDQGVIHWSGGSLSQFTEIDRLPDPQVLSVAYEPNEAYIGTPLGVAVFRDGAFSRTLADGFFAAALQITEESLVIGTLDEGIVEVPLSEQRTPRPPGGRATAAGPDGVHALVALDAMTLAVASDEVFGRTVGETGWPPIVPAPNLTLRDRNISALHVDSAGRIWVGYFDRGLDVLDADLTRVAAIENDQLFCVNRIKTAPGQQVTAVATANGFGYFDAAVRLQQFLTDDDGLIASHVTDMTFTGDTTVLATPSGLTYLDANGAQSLYAFHGLVNNHVYSLGAAGSQVLAGTLGGLSQLDSGQITSNSTTANSPLSHNWVSAIARWNDDWFIGLYGGGIVRLSPGGNWHSYPELEGVVINPNALVASPTRVYAGSLDRGVLVYESTEDNWHFLIEGLPSANVTALARANDTLYVGTDNGLVRASEAELIDQ